MTEEELKLEIVKYVFPVCRDISTFKNVSDTLYRWIAPRGLPTQLEACDFTKKQKEKKNSTNE